MNEIGRNTKYCDAIRAALHEHGHATNAELLQTLRGTFPELSATTVHRATARLAARGSIALAPPTPDGAMRYDANTRPHDHFVCLECGVVRDLDIAHSLMPRIERALGGCKVNGRLTVSGTCKHCVTTNEGDEL